MLVPTDRRLSYCSGFGYSSFYSNRIVKTPISCTNVTGFCHTFWFNAALVTSHATALTDYLGYVLDILAKNLTNGSNMLDSIL